MKLETFFEKFDQFADAPNAVAKMRELVLQSAVQGKLVRQDANDVPASKLIRDAVHARKKLVGARIVRDETPDLGFLDHVENGLPNGWCLAPLSVYVGVIMGQSPPSSAYNESGQGLPFYQGKSQFGKLYPTATDWCTEPTKIGEPGDVVISVRAPVGPTNMLREKSCIGRGLTSLRSLGGDQMHLLYTLRAYERSIAAMGVGSTFVAISKSDLDDFRIPVPPLAEQKRIVAKVDELLALCDRLGAQQQERERRHAALARASLARFADAPTPANLPFLFHSSYAIPPADLRKSILTLAVQGKLVPQDPNDGDARDMIDRAMEKRQQTIKTKSLRRKELDECADLFEHEDLPSSWCVERFANLVDPENTISYGVLVPGNDVPDGIPFVRAQDLCLSNHPARPNKTIAPEIEKPYARTRLTGGEILLCVVGSIGKLGVVPDSWAGANIARAVARIKPIPDVLRDYLLLVLQEQSVQNYFTTTTRTLAQPTLNVGMIEQTPIPVPPLAEQRRIVAKVEQLMALVDALETQLAASRATAANLLAAVVAELTASSSSTSIRERSNTAIKSINSICDDEATLLKVAEEAASYE